MLDCRWILSRSTARLPCRPVQTAAEGSPVTLLNKVHSHPLLIIILSLLLQLQLLPLLSKEVWTQTERSCVDASLVAFSSGMSYCLFSRLLFYFSYFFSSSSTYYHCLLFQCEAEYCHSNDLICGVYVWVGWRGWTDNNIDGMIYVIWVSLHINCRLYLCIILLM